MLEDAKSNERPLKHGSTKREHIYKSSTLPLVNIRSYREYDPLKSVLCF